MPNKREIALVTELSKAANRLFIYKGLLDKFYAVELFTELLKLNQCFKKSLG